jgi:hypothetical protein
MYDYVATLICSQIAAFCFRLPATGKQPPASPPDTPSITKARCDGGNIDACLLL